MKFMGRAKRRASLRARTELAFKYCLRASTSTFILGFPTVRSAGITREDYLVYPTLSQPARVYQIFDVTWFRIGFGSCSISFIPFPLYTRNAVHLSPLRLTVRRFRFATETGRDRRFADFPGVVSSTRESELASHGTFRKREEMLRR